VELGPAAPTPPIAFAGDPATVSSRSSVAVPVLDGVLDRLRGACAAVTTDPAERAEASRDWWPAAMVWALDDQVGGLASVVCRPSSADEVAAVLAICDETRIPVTAAGGRSGVLGGSVPVYGGVLLDLCGLSGIVDVDATSLVVDVQAGTFGDHLEDELRRDHGATVGHWPQSMALATVGGWVACRGAGQLSTRYGKIEDIVVGLDVVLADGRRIRTGGFPRQATGPDLTQLFVGSEGTLGVVTSARLRLHPVPATDRRTAWGFASFDLALDAMRRILQRGATPAVLRLYDGVESARSYGTDGTTCVLLSLDEGDPLIAETMIRVVEAECSPQAERLDAALVEQWLGHRNDVAALERLISGGLVVDTMEVTGPWAALPTIYRATIDAIGAVDGTLAVSAHQSHSYPDGGCLYFTFAGKVEPERRTEYHRAVWDAGVAAVLAHGGSLSHHHGVGLHRGRYLADALGSGFDVLASVKAALDPHGILNPGKLGLPSPFGAAPDLGLGTGTGTRS
jgi:alkyldihydroxyacetonephosphate synthase